MFIGFTKLPKPVTINLHVQTHVLTIERTIHDRKQFCSKELCQGYFTGGHLLFGKNNLQIKDTIWGEGESPLKESSQEKYLNAANYWKENGKSGAKF